MKEFVIMVLAMMYGVLYGGDALDIVENSVKGLKYSRADKSLIDAVERDPNYYTLKEGVKVKVEDFEDEVGIDYYLDVLVLANDGKKSIGEFISVVEAIDKIVNIGSKVWDMVIANKPVVKVENKYATALPMGVKNAGELSGWSKPRSYLISFYFENLYGIDVIRVSYKVTYVYGGSYGGKGKYLAGVWAIPVNIEVMWGFSFNMQAYVPDATVVNVGTSSNPIAALQLKVSWSASSLLKEIDGTGVYYIQGDGYFEEIASPFRGTRTDLKNINIE